MTVLEQGLKLNDRYVLIKKIGEGSYGEVWVAEDTFVGIDVAIKVFMAFDPQSLEDFKEEFRITFDLHHENLLGGMSCDVWERRPFIVMEYCPNGSAGKLAGNVNEETIWRFIRDVAHGLAYLHGHQPEPIIHRDIKPDNILVRTSGNFAITDFGLSKKTRATMRRMSGRAPSLGSPAYMGPELYVSQVGSSDPSRRNVSPSPVKATDIWALGVTVYELATADLPFCGRGGEMLNAHAEIPDLPETFSDDLNKVTRRMMLKETWDRPTAVQLEQWAERALRGEPVFDEPKDGGGGGDDDDRPKSRKQIWIGLSAVLVVLIALVFAFTGQNKKKLLKECELLEQRADAIRDNEKGYREALDNYKRIIKLVQDNHLDFNTGEVIRKEVEVERKIEERVKEYKEKVNRYKSAGEDIDAYNIVIINLKKILLLKEDDQLRKELTKYEEKLKEKSQHEMKLTECLINN